MTDYDPTLDPNKNQIRDYDGGQRQQDARYANIPPRPAMPTGELGDAPEGSLVPPALLRALQEYALLIEYAWMLDAREKQHAAEYLSVIRRQADLNNLNKRVQTPVSAWCADYTAALTGEVATLEVPGEVDPTIGGGLNIKPGDADAAAWNAAYGQIQMATVLTPAAFAWNFVMTVPWMKWRPLWRYATVVTVNGAADTLDLILFPILSRTADWLRNDGTINDPLASSPPVVPNRFMGAGVSMANVPVRYMSCGAAVFEEDDEVIVEFTLTSGGTVENLEATVIGFKQDPRPCGSIFYTDVGFPCLEGFYAPERVPTWRDAPIGGWRYGFFPAADGGYITANTSDVLRRYDRDGGLIWEASLGLGGYGHNYDSFRDLVIASRTGTADDSVVRFYHPDTGALQAGDITLSLAAGQFLAGVCAKAADGTLIYALGSAPGQTQDSEKAKNVLRIGGSSYSLHSIYDTAAQIDSWSYPLSTTCAGEFIFIYMYNDGENPAPGPHYIIQVTMTGQFVQVFPTPGEFPDIFTLQGNRVCAVSSGLKVPAWNPPPPPLPEDPPPD